MKKKLQVKAAKKQDPEVFSHRQLVRLNDENDAAYEGIRAYRAAELQRTGTRPSINTAINTLIIAGARAKEQQS